MNSYEEPADKPVNQSGSKATTIAIVVGVIGCCLIPFVIIAVSNLLGPHIGNVFSGMAVTSPPFSP